MIAPKRQAEPRFAPEIPLSVAAVPRPKAPASPEPAAVSKSTHLRLTRPNPTIPLPDPIPLKSSFQTVTTMNPTSNMISITRRLLFAACLLASGISLAQTVPSGASSPSDLAKYDKNKNGRLDADEQVAKEKDEARRARNAVGGNQSEPAAPVVEMSPFEVAADNRGYYAANTMAGTRIGSKLEDLGASITVVTKEQMTDFAMLDINDIFNYEASTEGTGNYTAFAFNRNGQPSSDAQIQPQSANRIRGMSSVNVTLGNFATSGWTPIDPLNIDAVEISRGPNASIFGIGNVGGTVNSVAAAANVTRNRTQVTTRGDTNDGYRGTLDLNRVLLPGVLALRGSMAYQHDGYQLKPSGTDTTRYNGMIKEAMQINLNICDNGAGWLNGSYGGGPASKISSSLCDAG